MIPTSLEEIGDSTAIVQAVAETDDRRGDVVLVLAANDKDQPIRGTAAEALKDRHDDWTGTSSRAKLAMSLAALGMRR